MRRTDRGDHLTVGDITLRNEDGFIGSIDRKKNMTVSGGENVSPSEVETCWPNILTWPTWRSSEVPDERWSEPVMAAIAARTGASPSDRGLVEWSATGLAGHERLRQIVFLTAEEMHRTPPARSCTTDCERCTGRTRPIPRHPRRRRNPSPIPTCLDSVE